MYYLLRSNEAHRQVLKGIGERLIKAMDVQLTAYTGTPPPQNHDDMLMARKWAGLLNYDLYRFEKANEDGMTAISIGYPADLVEALNEDATPAKLNLQISAALHAAIQIRDGKAAGDPVALWKQVRTALDRLKELNIKLEPYSRVGLLALIDLLLPHCRSFYFHPHCSSAPVCRLKN